MAETDDLFADGYALLEAVVEGSADAIFIKDLQGCYRLVNTTTARLLGRPREEVIGRDDRGLFPEAEARSLMEADRRAQQRVLTFEETLTLAHGERRTFLEAKGPVRDRAGRVVGTFGVARDVTEEKRAQAALQASEEKYRALFDQSSLGIYVHDPDGRIRDANRVACQQSGYARDELLRLTLFDLWPMQERDWALPRHEVLRRWREWRPEELLSLEGQLRRRDGSVYPVEISTGVVRLGEDRLLLAAVQDVSDRRRAEGLLRESERLRRLAMEAGRIGAFETDLRTGEGQWTPEIAGIWGIPEGFTGNFSQFCWDRVHPDDRAGAQVVYDRMMATGASTAQEFRVRRDDGTTRWIRWQAQPFPESEGRPARVVGVNVDVTERQLAEDETERIFEMTPALLCTARADGSFEKINGEWTRVLGFTREEILRAGYAGLVHPDDLGPTNAEVARQLAGGRTAHFVNRYRTRAGGYRTLEWTATPALDGRLYACARDITDQLRAEAEQARLEDQLHHAQKMEAVGTLAGGVAHDFNNILAGIAGGLSLLELREPLAASLPELADMKALVERGAELTKQLLGFSRRGKYDVRPHDLVEVVRRTSTMFGRTRRDVVVEHDFARDLPPVLMDYTQLEQVLLNLFVNAGQAMPAGGQLLLRATCTAVGPERAAAAGIAPGRYLELVVADTGVGMDAATRARIFEPFFTTKPPGQGTGLGLASVYGIVQHHGGAISVESEPGKGAAFTILLPASEQPVAETAARAAPVATGHGTVLLVDDEQELLRLNSGVLASLGYEVLTASSGRAAVEAVRAHRGRLWLVLLDLTMPEMSGARTYEAIRELAPDLKVLLCSGFAEDGQARELLARGCCGFLQKPFDRAALAARLQSLA